MRRVQHGLNSSHSERFLAGLGHSPLNLYFSAVTKTSSLTLTVWRRRMLLGDKSIGRIYINVGEILDKSVGPSQGDSIVLSYSPNLYTDARKP